MADENSKSTDDLLRLISDRLWSVGEGHTFDLGQYGVSGVELPTVLQKVKDKELDYELSKSSNGRSTLKVYKRSQSSILENIKFCIVLPFVIAFMMSNILALGLLLVFVYLPLTIVSKLLDNHWIPLEDFWNSYWNFLYGEDR